MPDNENEWLKVYYSKLIADKNIDVGRKDTFTNWALFGLFAIIAIYVQCNSTDSLNTSFNKISILIISILIVLRFFNHSTISYKNISRLNEIKQSIEQLWMNKKTDINEIVTKINDLDHNAYTPTRKTKYTDYIFPTLKSGFLLIFAIPLILLIYELFTIDINQFNWVGFTLELIGFICYTIYELISVRRYLLKQKEDSKTNNKTDNKFVKEPTKITSQTVGK